MGRQARAAWALDVVAIGAAVGVLVAVGLRPFGDPPAGPGTTPSLVVMWAAAVSALLLITVVAIARRPPRLTGAGMVAFALVVAGLATVGVSPMVKIVAIAAAAGLTLAIAVFVGTVLDARSGLVVVVLAVTTIVCVAARVLVRDPFQQLRCAPYCLENPLLVVARADWVAAADRALAVVAVAWCATTVPAIARSRLSIWSRAAAATAVAAALLASLVSLAEPGLSTWGGSTTWTLTVVPAALVIAFVLAAQPHLQVGRTQIRARNLASAMAESLRAGGVAGHLQEVAHDPSIRLLFPSGSDTYLGPHGRAVERRERCATTTVEWGGEPIAVIEHSSSSRARLGATLSPAVTVAIENERLRALAISELAELRASRHRIVERADEARRRLERDLHDGAQQRLLLLGIELSRTAETAEDDGRQRYLNAIGHTQDALAELRALVHERHPPVLHDLGLVEALRSLAETSPLPLLIELDGPFRQRPPPAVERVAYDLTLAMIGDGDAAGASKVSIRLTGGTNELTVILRHDAMHAVDPTDAEDRVGAVGGSLLVTIGPDGVEYVASFP